MRRTSLWVAVSLAATCLNAFGSPPPSDPVLDCAAPANARSAEERELCALAAIELACATDRAQLAGGISRALGVHNLQVLKAMGRHTLGSLERGDLCARDEKERKQVIAASYAAKKTPSESPIEWLKLHLTGPDGKINHAGVSEALDQRAALLPQAKRAGLPPSPSVGWTNLTGYSQSAGRINHILFTSGTGQDILAGADGGGIWRTTNGGTSWVAINDFLGSLSISNFAKSPADANTIYAGTNTHGSHTYFPAGIVKSIDNGLNWSPLAQTNPSTNADFAYVQRVAVSPTNSQVVLAATDHGAYLSTDGGANWGTRIGAIATTAYYVAIHPTNGNYMAIAYDDGTIRYTTSGDLVGGGALAATVLSGGRYMKLAYAKSDVTRMYALVTDGTTGNTRLFTSATSGGGWTEIALTDASINGQLYQSSYLSYTGGLWVDPFNANRLAICEGWAWFTTDASAVTPVWKRLYSGWTDYHGIVESPLYDGTTNRPVFFMDDGGLYRVSDINTLDQFGSFTRLDAGMAVTEVYSASGKGGVPILGAQDVAPKTYRSAMWQFLARPYNVAAGCSNVSGCGSWIGDGSTTAASAANSLVLYGSRQYLDLIRSTDGGVNGNSIVYGSALNEGRGATSPNFLAGFIAPFVLDPSNQSRMLAGARSLWRSNDVDTGSPPTWTAIRAPYEEASSCPGYFPNIGTIAIAPSNPDVVWIAYIGCVSRVFKSVNATQVTPTWTEVTTLPVNATGRVKASITIDRFDPNIVWIGVSQYQAQTLFKTTDGGATGGAWSAVAGLPGAPVNSLRQHPKSTSWLYAATSVGLFASTDGGATWSASNEGPANVVVKSLDWNTSGWVSELLVGTYGRGVWKASVAVARTDFNAEGRSDLLYRNNSTGMVYRFFANGFTLSGGAIPYNEPNLAWKIVADADFNGDGVSDFLYRNDATGQVYYIPLNSSGLPTAGAGLVTIEPNLSWKIVHTPDLNGDGKADILWWNSATGQVWAMIMNGATITAQNLVYTEPNTAWKIVGTGDFSGSGKSNQLVWRNSSTGQVFLMTVTVNGSTFTQTGQLIYQDPNTAWKIISTADFNGDGKSDLLWRNDVTGQLYMMLMNGPVIASQAMIYAEPNLAWKIVAQGDYNGDGKADLLWRNDTSGQVYMMLMNGFTISSQAMVYTEPNTAWRVLGPWEYGQGTGILLASLGAKGMASTFQGTPLNPGRIEGTLVNPSPGISGHPVNQTPDMERTSNLQ